MELVFKDTGAQALRPVKRPSSDERISNCVRSRTRHSNPEITRLNSLLNQRANAGPILRAEIAFCKDFLPHREVCWRTACANFVARKKSVRQFDNPELALPKLIAQPCPLRTPLVARNDVTTHPVIL